MLKIIVICIEINEKKANNYNYTTVELFQVTRLLKSGNEPFEKFQLKYYFRNLNSSLSRHFSKNNHICNIK